MWSRYRLCAGDYDKLRPDPGEQRVQVQEVFLHPHFHSFTFDSDVALVLLARPVTRGPTAAPACLPDPHLSKYLLQVSRVASVSMVTRLKARVLRTGTTGRCPAGG